MKQCIFCEIYKKKTNIIGKTKNLFFIKDIKPKYKNHILAITKKHIIDIKKLSKNRKLLLNSIKEIIFFLKEKKKLDYQLITNQGKFQTIKHLHIHIYYD